MMFIVNSEFIPKPTAPLQVKHAALSADFEKEVAALELKFSALHQPLYEQVLTHAYTCLKSELAPWTALQDYPRRVRAD